MKGLGLGLGLVGTGLGLISLRRFEFVRLSGLQGLVIRVVPGQGSTAGLFLSHFFQYLEPL